MKVPIRQVIAILLCWMVMPAIFLWTPIKTRNLRLIVASCLLVLTLCLSILHMFEAPKNINYLYWESLYGAASSYALIRRNWGRVAILESATEGDQVERTSTSKCFTALPDSAIGRQIALHQGSIPPFGLSWLSVELSDVASLANGNSSDSHALRASCLRACRQYHSPTS